MKEQSSPVWNGRYLAVHRSGNWEFATRNTGRPAVGIVAITADDRVVLVEQHRPPVGRVVIELPAGLVGDSHDDAEESLLTAAQRELLEETGYVAEQWTELVSGYSSPGLTDEAIVLFLAEKLRKEHPGGGVDGEAITLHEVPLGEVFNWLSRRGDVADLKLLAGLYAAQCHRQLGSKNN